MWEWPKLENLENTEQNSEVETPALSARSVDSGSDSTLPQFQFKIILTLR